MTEPYTKPDAPLPPYHVGQLVHYTDGTFEVTAVSPILSPYRKAGQETRITGWSLGLRRVGEKPRSRYALPMLIASAAMFNRRDP